MEGFDQYSGTLLLKYAIELPSFRGKDLVVLIERCGLIPATQVITTIVEVYFFHLLHISDWN